MTLYVVSTPIGNLEDLTPRALKALSAAHVVACEDTRHSGRLLTHFGLHKTLVRYDEHVHHRETPRLLERLRRGEDVALVTDAGTPGVSDPGFPLIRAALEKGIPVIPIPGPSAVTAALCASGLPTHSFLFVGFPPPKTVGLKKRLASLAREEATLIFFLPTRKAAQFLRAVDEVLGDRRVVVARELTKAHEEFLRGRARELAARLESKSLKGEATILIKGM